MASTQERRKRSAPSMDDGNVSDYETTQFIKFQQALFDRMNELKCPAVWSKIPLLLEDERTSGYRVIIYRRSSGMLYLQSVHPESSTEMYCMNDVYRVFIEDLTLRNSETLNTIRAYDIDDFVKLLELDVDEDL